METIIGEFMNTLVPHVSSVQQHRGGAPHSKRAIGLAENEVVLLLSALVYELLHPLRCQLVEATDEG